MLFPFLIYKIFYMRLLKNIFFAALARLPLAEWPLSRYALMLLDNRQYRGQAGTKTLNF